MPEICDAAIHLCRVRVTRLDQLGHPQPGPNNAYVTSNAMMLTVKPQIEAGADRVLTGGCDCIIANYKGPDKLKRFDLEMDLGKVEPSLLEMLTGAPARTDGSGTVIGIDFPTQLSCGAAVQPNVAVEGWQDAWTDDHQDPLLPYIHWVFPSTHWQFGDMPLQNDFFQPKVLGFTRGNPSWGIGPYGDLSHEIGVQGGWEFTSLIPAAFCGYLSQHVT